MATVLYLFATAVTIWGVAIVLSNRSAVNLAYLAPLIAIFLTVAAGVQELDKRRGEREVENRRRFDERFAEATKGLAASNARDHAAAAAELMFFLRDENAAFSHQTYYYLLCHLRSGSSRTNFDRILIRAFDRAAHRVLPEARHLLPRDTRAMADSGDLIPAQEMRAAVDFTDAYLEGSDLSGLELAEATLTSVVLKGANLSGTCLWRAQGKDVNLQHAELSHANLEESRLLHVNGKGADFSCANLVAARFGPKGGPNSADARSSLCNARFVNARLQGASFNGADISDAHFEGANLRGASFRDVKMNNAAAYTIVRAKNGSWRRAHWDPEVFVGLCDIAASHPVRVAPRVHPSELPRTHYRRHPYPGHPDPFHRSLSAGL